MIDDLVSTVKRVKIVPNFKWDFSSSKVLKLNYLYCFIHNISTINCTKISPKPGVKDEIKIKLIKCKTLGYLSQNYILTFLLSHAFCLIL